jgi:hypothetical protein
MIPVPASTKIWLAAGVTDMRNYVERRIMRSPPQSSQLLPSIPIG